MIHDYDYEIKDYPLTQAIDDDDLDQVKSLLNSDKSILDEELEGIPVLNIHLQCAFYQKRWEIFTFLLHQNVDLNLALDDKVRDTLLIHMARLSDEGRYILALIEQNADVNCQNNEGNTFLHYAVQNCSTETGRAALDKGADVNAENHKGQTPLFLACQSGNIDWVHMLLYYGAIATISTHDGRLPLTIAGVDYPQEQEELFTLLYNHTFDEDFVKMPLPSLVDGIIRDCDIVNEVSELVYTDEGLEYLQNHLDVVQARGFKILTERFQGVVRELVEFFDPLEKIIEVYRSKCTLSDLKGVLMTFLESDYGADFVRNFTKMYPSVAHLVKGFFETECDPEEITKIICVLLSYGLEVTTCDLDVIYEYYGFCELFTILLHMDVHYVNYWVVGESQSMAVLYYDITSDLEDLLKRLPLSVNLLSYFNHRILKGRDLDEEMYEEYEEIIWKIRHKLQSLPDVGSLAELSRNAARKFIVTGFKATNSRQFYTILNSLPIDRLTRNIISLKKKLY